MKNLIRFGILLTFIIFSAAAASAQTDKSSRNGGKSEGDYVK